MGCKLALPHNEVVGFHSLRGAWQGQDGSAVVRVELCAIAELFSQRLKR
jgi:hypothetical protein